MWQVAGVEIVPARVMLVATWNEAVPHGDALVCPISPLGRLRDSFRAPAPDFLQRYELVIVGGSAN